MIRKSELSIGNWVYFDGEIRQIEAWMLIQPCKSILPIQLTQDILKKCDSFSITIKDGEKSWFNGDDIMIREADMALFLHSEVNGSVHYACILRYVHKLQNIYLAITDEELNIQL